MNFPINTQEDFDKAYEERLANEKELLMKKYADYDEIRAKRKELEAQLKELHTSFEDLTKKSTEKDQALDELTSKVKAQESAALKTRIAHEMGIPYELAGRLTGEDEKALRKDAETLSGLIKRKAAPPLKAEAPDTNGKDSAYSALLEAINN